ncbi:hypothetical protein MMC26_003392 [Xylographa opegraphella]|nr:hypothetical protein [Xylographa opegraphella]
MPPVSPPPSPQPANSPFTQEFNRPPHLPHEPIYVPPQHQPLNPEDEDDVVPDQHAAFGIQRATQMKREPAWKDLGLEELLRKGPKEGGEGKVRAGKWSAVMPR